MKMKQETLILGGGPGGYVAAIKCAKLGQSVTIVENEYLGGTCLNAGCIPSKSILTAGYRYRKLELEEMGITVDNLKLNLDSLQGWKKNNVAYLKAGVEGLVKKNKIKIINGFGVIKDKETVTITLVDGTTIDEKYTHLILATGAHAKEHAQIAYSKRILKSTEILKIDFETIPSNLAIIGNDFISVQLATAFQNIGVNVTFIAEKLQILEEFSEDVSERLLNQLEQRGVKVVISEQTPIVEETSSSVNITLEEKITVDYLVYSIGRTPNTKNLGLEQCQIAMNDDGFIQIDEQCRTTCPHIYAIGDIVGGAMTAHKASYEGKIAAEAISGGKRIVDFYALPTIIYVNPELAQVGYNVKEAIEKGYEIDTITFRHLSQSEDEMIRMFCRQSDGLVIGVEMIGKFACEWCGVMTLAIECGLCLNDLTNQLISKCYFKD